MQLVVMHARRAVFELAHALVDQADEILDAIGNRRVGGVAGIFRIAALVKPAVARRVAILQIGALRERNDFGEDFDFFVDAACRPPKNASIVSSKLNSQNGRRRLRGVRTCALSPKQRPYSLCGSTRKIRRSGFDCKNLLQHDGDAAGFADAGGAEDGEMLVEQFVDIDLRVDASDPDAASRSCAPPAMPP